MKMNPFSIFTKKKPPIFISDYVKSSGKYPDFEKKYKWPMVVLGVTPIRLSYTGGYIIECKDENGDYHDFYINAVEKFIQ